MTVTKAFKTLNVGERGIYHAKTILENGTPEEIAACDSGVVAASTTAKAIRSMNRLTWFRRRPLQFLDCP